MADRRYGYGRDDRRGYGQGGYQGRGGGGGRYGQGGYGGGHQQGQFGGHRGGGRGYRGGGRGFRGRGGGRGRGRGGGGGGRGRAAKNKYSERASQTLIDALIAESRATRDGNGANRTPVVTYRMNGTRFRAQISKTKGSIWFCEIDENGTTVRTTMKVPKEIPKERATMDFFYALTDYRFRQQLANEERQRQQNEKAKILKEQQEKPSTEKGADNDNVKAEDDEKEVMIEWDHEKYNVEDFEGVTIEWVRSSPDRLPQRLEVAKYGDTKKDEMSVVTNFYKLAKAFDSVHVYLVRIYPKGSANPVADDQNLQEHERWQIVQSGSSPTERRKKQAILRRLFKTDSNPRPFLLFDGKQLFLIGEKMESTQSDEFAPSTIVSFEYQSQLSMEDVAKRVEGKKPVVKDENESKERDRVTSSTEATRLLNLINRYRLIKAQFTKLSRKGKCWFDERAELDNRQILRSTGQQSNLDHPQCELWQGFDVTFRRTDRGVGIIADLATKVMIKPSLHEILENAYNRNPNIDLISFFNEHFRGRIAIVSYSRRFIKMESIDLNQDEKTKFERRDGDKISYRSYLQERYGQQTTFRERCVIKSASGAAFLPQFLNIGATNEQIGNPGIEEIRGFKEQMTPQQRMDQIAGFIKVANDRLHSLRKAFETAECPIEATADILPNVYLEIVNRNGQKRYGDQNEFNKVYREVADFNPVHDQWQPAPLRLGIMHDRNDRDGYRVAVEHLNTFLHKRNFPRGREPFGDRPNPVDIPYDLYEGKGSKVTDDELKRISQMVVSHRVNCVLVILNKDKKCKVYLTKALQFDRYTQSPIMYQAVSQNNLKKYPLWGCFEDILIKAGYPLFRILPNLPDKKSIFNDHKRFMVISINLTGNTRPTVAVMATINDVYDPSLEHYQFHSCLLPERKDVIGVQKMELLARNAIQDGLRKHIALYRLTQFEDENEDENEKENKNEDKNEKENEKKKKKKKKTHFPEYLVIMRSGVATGQIPFVQTKELVGIKRAIYRIKKDKRNRELWGEESLKNWKPQYFTIMVNKRIAEKVFERDRRGMYQNPSRPLVLQQRITSDNLWDVILHVGGGTKAEKKWSPTKLTVLEWPMDENGNTTVPGEFRNLIQLVHATHYGFGFSVPFPMGPGGLPAPIHYAQHYAEWMKEMILSRDEEERDLCIDTEKVTVSKRPKIVYYR